VTYFPAPRRFVLWLGLVVGLGWASSASALQVAPNVVFIHAGERGSELTLRNGGGAPVEVQIRVIFGFEDAGDDGQVRAVYPDRHPRSAADWIRAYPQRTIVAPNARQSIRLFSRAPADLPPGEYWARVEVQSRPAQTASRSVEGEDDIQVRVGVTTRQRIPIFVRVGEVESSLAIASVQARLDTRQEGEGAATREVVATYSARIRGNAAFLGTMKARIENGQRVIAERDALLAVFVAGRRRIRIPLSDDVRAEDLAGARLVLEARHEHPALQERDFVPGRTAPWSGPLAVE
jgi:P pilus assembly chaperone PapD